MHIENAGQALFVVDNQQRIDLPVLHDAQRFRGENIGRDRGAVWCHHRGDRRRGDVQFLVQDPA